MLEFKVLEALTDHWEHHLIFYRCCCKFLNDF